MKQSIAPFTRPWVDGCWVDFMTGLWIDLMTG